MQKETVKGSILLDNCSRKMYIVRISFDHGNVIVVAAYISPVSNGFSSGDILANFYFFCTYVDNILWPYPQDKIIILGNFNVRKIKWGFQDVLHWLPME